MPRSAGPLRGLELRAISKTSEAQRKVSINPSASPGLEAAMGAAQACEAEGCRVTVMIMNVAGLGVGWTPGGAEDESYALAGVNAIADRLPQ